MVDMPARSGAPLQRPSQPLPQPQDTVLRIPLSMIRYRQRPLESGRGCAPDWVDGPAVPQGHVIHRTLSF